VPFSERASRTIARDLTGLRRIAGSC
jgi:hypothetical protein